MGKSLKGRELGVGISQRKDGLYSGRYTDNQGKRIQKYFGKLQDCREWMADMQLKKEQGYLKAFGDMTVDVWFNFWLDEIKGNNIRPTTRKNYQNRYKHNIQKKIGNLKIDEVKPLHCQHVLNSMISGYRRTSIAQTRVVMFSVFESAVENEVILKNPVTKAVKCIAGGESREKRVLTLNEQRIFLEGARQSDYFSQYAFVLQTGLRSGEISGLRWDDVDIAKKVLHVRRTLWFDSDSKQWIINSPKSRAGMRDVPLTQEAINILVTQKKLRLIKVLPIEFANHVFLRWDGKAVQAMTYDQDLRAICDRIGIKRISMHTLRHTFATRCIESGMKPKTLQMILGHANISMTMDLYVHVTEEEKVREMERVESDFLLSKLV